MKLTVKKSLFAEAVLSGSTISEAAIAAGIKETAAYNWLRDGLRDYIMERRKAAFEAGLNKLEKQLAGAVDTLQELMTDTETPPPQRLGAAKTIIEQTVKLFELRDIEARLSALEQAQAANSP
jgi:phage terminase small subunit